MSGFIEGEDRTQATLFPERIDDYVAEENTVRVIDVFVDELDLSSLGFKTIQKRLADLLTIRPSCSSSISMGTSIASSLPAAWNEKQGVTLS